MAKERKTTIEDLARITAKGFEANEKRFDTLETDMQKGFDRIENLLLRDHLNRIERLEDTVLQLKVKVGMR
ncbi:MAG: hypothetical protein Q7R88_02965 [bacterium]|nr:hypothetical protein [bacterium]